MCPHRVATKRNINTFHCRLLFEEDPQARDILSTLLVEEENRFGRTQEHLLLIKRKIALGKILIEKQKKIVSDFLRVGNDATLAKRTLRNFMETQKLLSDRLEILER